MPSTTSQGEGLASHSIRGPENPSVPGKKSPRSPASKDGYQEGCTSYNP